MKLYGLAHALERQMESSSFDKLAFEERVGMLVDQEWTDRQTRKLTRRLAQAKLREQACIEDIDYRHRRGLDRKLMARLSTCQWIDQSQNVILFGPTGVGKTFLACALANKACQESKTALYRRVPRLLNELALARADGSYSRLLARWAKVDVLILDDWGLAPLKDHERRDMLEILDDRYGNRATIVASQLPLKHWHKIIGDPTIADAICDRLVHAAHTITLSGDSMRKKKAPQSCKETPKKTK
jgi:DNA replication protein DnaC